MPNWTKEQQEAIDMEGTNIIVSAGAGSGKTAVLSERALRKVKDGIDIDRLLILTFTKAAAYEMMIRIRENIKSASFKEQVQKIEKAYITTFDSFALSVVRRYHANLNISKNVSIMDESVISLIKKEILDQIFDEFYQKESPQFSHLIRDFCIKDDQELKESILKINEKLDMKYDKGTYLDSYFTRFEKKNIEKYIHLYVEQLKRERDRIYSELDKIRIEVDGDYYQKLLEGLKELFESDTYDALKTALDVIVPPIPRGSSDEVKKSKENIGKILNSLREKCIYQNQEEIMEVILSTKDYIEAILEIIQVLDERVLEYKYTHDVFEFVDISKMAIRLVKENDDIRTELKNSFDEIMVDEYQDTSDLQEEFIQLIANHNLYMVGDIKQSIYRFRNANPNIFKEKYDSYARKEGGYKIDLVKNFRSREEVLHDINYIFNLIMDDQFGGADYALTHQMVFGNQTYNEEGKTNQNYQTEIYNYTYDKDSEFTKDEIEAFMVCQDIKEKMNAHYQVFDKKKGKLRDVSYHDFVILMDHSSKFELYKKIFEYEKIPLTILKDENIMDQMEIYLVNHLIQLVLKASKKEFDKTFEYAFLSIGRSYLFEMSDQELFCILKNKTFKDTELYHLLEPFFSKIATLDIENFVIQLIDSFQFFTKLIRVGNVEISTNNLEYMIETASSLKKLGYTLEDFSIYLKNTIESGKEIKIPMSSSHGDCVQIMTIHKSKGLEYPICYYTGLFSTFNMNDLKDKILFDSTYGIITPYFKDGCGETIYKSLFKEKYYLEEISEKIRLFYVALTRCKEKIILLADLQEEESILEDGKVEDSRRHAYNSFLQFLISIYDYLDGYCKQIDLKKVPMSLDYKKRNSKHLQEILSPNSKTIQVKEIYISGETETKETFSKTAKEIFSPVIVKSVEFGKEFHRLLEYLDFNQPNLDGVPSWMAEKIQSFLNLPLLSNLKKATIYKEYEFIDEKDQKEYHGVIDLMLVYEDHVDIIDYKLKNTMDHEYQKQLDGYRSYIEKMTKKNTNIYLYSIIDEKLTQL